MLIDFYSKKIKEAQTYLRKVGYDLSVCTKEDSGILEIVRKTHILYKEFWKLKVKGQSRLFNLIVAIPNSFPDTFPRIYLSLKDFQDIYPIPHLDKNRFICTRDPEVVVLSDTKTGEATDFLIKVAVSLLEEGIAKKNHADYVEEFLAYWNESATYNFLGLFIPPDKVSYLNIYRLNGPLFGSKCIISESRELIENWLQPFNVTYLESKTIKALYLPIEPFSPLVIRTDQDLINIISDPNQRKNVEKYFNQNRQHNIIIASFLSNKERIVFGWRHRGWNHVNIKGFRKDHIPLDIRLAQTKDRVIEKIKITRLDRKRIFKRGGAMSTLLDKNISIAIIGCGSLGSLLTMSLARCGIPKFLLIDKECLEPENTPRHLCGFIEASRNEKKVESVKNRIKGHFPYIECDVKDDDILKILEEDEAILNEYDLIIVALGNMAIERRINYLLKNKAITSPILYLWVEPLGVGGQMLYVNLDEGGCYDCAFDNKRTFLYSIVDESEVFKKRESGCQTTYTPYSSLYVEQFIAIATRKILAVLNNEIKSPHVITWLGDLEAFEKSGHKLNPLYDAQLPYRIIEKQLFKRDSCNTCGNPKKDT